MYPNLSVIINNNYHSQSTTDYSNPLPQLPATAKQMYILTGEIIWLSPSNDAELKTPMSSRFIWHAIPRVGDGDYIPASKIGSSRSEISRINNEMNGWVSWKQQQRRGIRQFPIHSSANPKQGGSKVDESIDIDKKGCHRNPFHHTEKERRNAGLQFRRSPYSSNPPGVCVVISRRARGVFA